MLDLAVALRSPAPGCAQNGNGTRTYEGRPLVTPEMAETDPWTAGHIGDWRAPKTHELAVLNPPSTKVGAGSMPAPGTSREWCELVCCVWQGSATVAAAPVPARNLHGVRRGGRSGVSDHGHVRDRWPGSVEGDSARWLSRNHWAQARHWRRVRGGPSAGGVGVRPDGGGAPGVVAPRCE